MSFIGKTSGDPRTTSKSLGHVLITGGCGFLGSTIVSLLLSRSAASKVSVLDIKPSQNPYDGVEYHFGDITKYDSIYELFAKIKPDVVIHTASPLFNANMPELMYSVNVDGTRTLVKAAQETGVKAFVYTSSASVISDTQSDLINADETYPLIMGDRQPEYYTTTKALAELHVLTSNRPSSHPRFLTTAIRPSAIFGVGDVQLLPQGLAAYYDGKTRFQVGQNTNLFDFTETTNVAHAHHLAAAALLATHDREEAGSGPPLDYERVDGEAFLVTNDTPTYFYDFARLCWATAGDTTKASDVWVLSKDFGLLVATIMEWVYWAFAWGKPSLTRQQVRYSCMTRYYNIDKARRRLGYKPIVSLEDGVRRGVKDAIARGVVRGSPEWIEKQKREEKKVQ
ncbi:erg26, C-3 sterol dehydrogenase [Elasticomyces elasticus]|nr:erg26, C-3 sterol dehydrogenase [Elasticomyces elasticus]